jgi:hypothetical protein
MSESVVIVTGALTGIGEGDRLGVRTRPRWEARRGRRCHRVHGPQSGDISDRPDTVSRRRTQGGLTTMTSMTTHHPWPPSIDAASSR